ncbi:MAG: hypothetical protein ACE5I3_11750, partial [Phycisphaerae bacterium]
AAEIPAYALLRTAIMGNLRRTWDGRASDEVPKEELAKGFNLLTIIGGALAEGLSLFGLVILLVSGNWLAVAAPVIGLLLLAAQLPTRDRFNRFAGNVTGQHWM